MLASCNDFLTGQDGEPHGALKVTKLTLNDNGLNRVSGSVVTDTSVPSDCSAAAVKDLPKCNADPFGDKYGVVKSPPNPDSARFLRVVFNKAPMNVAMVPLEPVPEVGLPSAATPLKLANPNIIKLTCQNCSTDGTNMGVPPSYNSLQLTGTDLSPDPSQYAFGPGIQMEVIATCPKATTLPAAPTKCQLAGPSYVSDPARALEPGATYSVVLDPALQGRLADGTDTIQLDDSAKALLTFTTEPFMPLLVGIGGDADNEITASSAGALSADTSGGAQLDNEGAVVLSLNAPADERSFTTQTVSASVSINGAAGMSVPVIVSTATGAPTKCSYGNRRSLYIAPLAGQWLPMAQAGAVVTITLRGSEVRDLSQLPNHPANKGIHVLAKDITIKATILSASADPDAYGGVYAADVVSPSGC